MAMQTQCNVEGLSSIARKAQFTAQKIATELEEQAQSMAQKIQEQSAQIALQAQVAKVEQEQMA